MPKTNCCEKCRAHDLSGGIKFCSNPNCECHGEEKTMAEKINFICKKVGIVGAPDDGGEKINNLMQEKLNPNPPPKIGRKDLMKSFQL